MCSKSQALGIIIPFLEDTGSTAHKTIYFDGWDGLAASAVLRAIAEDPPPSLKKKFDKILRIDCSRWKSRRALQRAVADELNLNHRVMAAFDRQDVEDDFSGVDEGSRAEVADVTREIYQTISDFSCLVIFHNGSENTVDIAEFGFPRHDWFSGRTNKVFWTFRERLRLSPEVKQKVDSSHLSIYLPIDWPFDSDTAKLILDEATEIVKYIQHKHNITPEIVAKCITYLLWFNEKGGGTMEYNWGTHASNYWVCDGIIEEGQSDESWEVAAVLHQQMRLEDITSQTVHFRGHEYRKHWKSVIDPSNIEEETSSFFLAGKKRLSLPPKMFEQSDRLCVLKLSGCNFSFHSPPFCCCRSLRFLGLDNCKDQPLEEEEKQQGRPIMEFFKSLWVLDISHMDWELDLSQDILDQMATNIREIHVKKGRIWRSNHAWRILQNLRRLKVIKPTSSWETGLKNEFMDMVKLHLLDLSGNNAIHVLPSLCRATGLKTLVLDGCVGLEHVGPEELPPSLESFSFNAGTGEDGSTIAKISRITLAGCAKLVDFRLLGSLPNLEELDLSRTAVKILDLKKEIQVENLQRIFLTGCERLRSIIWPEEGMHQLRLLCVNTQRELVLRETSRDSLVCREQGEYCHAHVCVTDMRFLQSLVLTGGGWFGWTTAPFKLNLYLSCAIKDDGKNCNNETMGRRLTTHKSSMSMTGCAYNDISIEGVSTEINGSRAPQFEPQDLHVVIGRGTMDTNVLNAKGVGAIRFTMDSVMSLHVHDSCSITTIIPKHIATASGEEIRYRAVKWCRVEKCPKLEVVFHTNYDGGSFLFDQLETFWAADLLMARYIWSKGRPYPRADRESFAKLRAVHLHMCPRLQFVLPLSWGNTLSSLETLHIVCCRDLKQVFPVESDFLERIATEHPNGMLEFPKLKHLYLHDLSCLQQICEAKIFAPKLETVRLRGCWGLRRLPATDRHRRREGRRVAVECEKDWWDNLEWDGLDVGHHPSLFAPHHSAYYKKRVLRTTVLR